MYVEEFITKLQKLKKELKHKNIKIVSQNGLLQKPELKIVLKDKTDALNLSEENVDYILII